MSSRISDEELIDDLLEFADELGYTPTTREMNEEGPHPTITYADHFGSWLEALDVANLDPKDRPQNRRRGRFAIPVEDAYEDVRRVADELGYTPQKNEYADHGRFSTHITAIKNHLNWWHFVHAAGLDASELRAPTRPHLLEILYRLEIHLDQMPTEEDVEEYSPYPSSLYDQVFGSVESAAYLLKVELEMTDIEEPEVEGPEPETPTAIVSEEVSSR